MLADVLHLAASPWIYLLVLVAVAVDAVIPIVPSETLVIGLGALAVHGRPGLWPLAAAVVAGGVVGDCLAYEVGRRAGRRAAHGHARRALRAHGGPAIVAGRFLPGGRTATTLAAGSVGMPVGRFRLFSLAAGTAWAAYAITIGHLGGVAFQGNPLIGVAVGLGVGAAVAAGYRLVAERSRSTSVDRSDFGGSGTPRSAKTLQAAIPGGSGERRGEQG
jgi:membrane-associated protein